MKTIFKRVVAYIIDMFLVSLVATMLTSNSYINKDYNKYTDIYDEYSKYSNNYNDFIATIEEFNDKDTITIEDLNTLIEEYPEYKNYITNIDSKDKLNNIKEEVQNQYKLVEEDYAYKLIKLSIIQKIISVLCILMYFVVIQYYLNGQTLGKKLMKLQVKSNNNKNLTILNYFIRSLILNEVVINVMNIICILVLSKSSYITYNQIIYFVTYIIEMTILFMIMFDKDNRGLHDYASNTRVIDLVE